MIYLFQTIIPRGFATNALYVKISFIRLMLFLKASLRIFFYYQQIVACFFFISFETCRYVLTLSIRIFCDIQRIVTCVFFLSLMLSELWSSRTSEPNISKYPIRLRLFIFFLFKNDRREEHSPRSSCYQIDSFNLRQKCQERTII